ncbi:TnsD family Tn7-like transposition protein [Paraburkholderia tagetis]|uniref:TnsD family transposase n=1 Tax=Paraburkholderia tagetis TaxID=2913261 RepID=A0A9X1RRZ6_9BURK|nr:TnsD family Tn7-like transposition protein [Paraburkholderia tagetis]MCG5076243.1 TnsD family transposase [Paraburkholderia tagetis]
MIGYFPPFYEDELLFSAVGRYHRHTMARSWRDTLREVYGDNIFQVAVEFPVYLEAFKLHVGDLIPETVDELIWNRTLFPYYAAFVGPERQRALSAVMKDKVKFRGSMFSRLGLAFTGILAPEYLRTCPACLEEDARVLGETYWRRAHQLQGVHFCVRHATALVETEVQIRPVGGGQNEQHCADLRMATRPYLTGLSDREEALLLKISELAVALLKGQSSSTLDEHRALYLDKLHNAGFMRNSHMVDCLEFESEFKAFYGGRLLGLLHSDFKMGYIHSWLREYVKVRVGTHHPLRHVLLTNFLDESADRNHNKVAIRSGPWQCKNPAADHFGLATITSYTILKHNKVGSRAGRFLCGCGYEFTARLDKVDDKGQPVKMRVTRFGEVFAKKVHELVGAGYPHTTVAKMLGVNLRIARRILSGADRRRSHNGTSQLTRKMRLRMIRPDTITSTSTSKGPIDWAARDKKCSEKVREAALKITASTPPQQVTRAGIKRFIGDRSLTTKLRDNKLPETATALALLTETLEAFQCRKAKWVYDHWRAEVPLTAWRLRKEARVTLGKASPAVIEFIERLINDGAH